MQHLHEIPSRELFPGFSFKLVHGAQTTLSFVDIKKGSILPEHRHIHEQVTYLLEGQLDMVIGNEKFSLLPGMVHVIPSNTPHSAIAVSDTRVIDFFSPCREDYK
jgi:quercetin dioxygenase-like cupin family protein